MSPSRTDPAAGHGVGMSATKTGPASPTAISRLLKAKGHNRSEKHPSHMVRGWVEVTRGFEVQAVMRRETRRARHGVYANGHPRYRTLSDNTFTGVVEIQWRLGGAGRKSAAERATIMDISLDAITKTLVEAGYHVEREARGVAQVPYLLVSRRDADGAVIER